MKRKLIRLSPSTSVVSLPAGWIRKNKIQKGAELELNESDNEIVVSAKSKRTERDITIDIKNLVDRSLWIYVDAAYVAGYDSITLLTKGHDQHEQLSSMVKWFPGLIIYEERKNMVVFKDITGDSQEDVDKIMARIFNINISLLEDMIEAVKAKDWEALKNAKRKDYLVNSYVSYCQRMINKYGYKSFSKNGLVCTYLKLLEMVSDKMANLFAAIGEKKSFKSVSILHQILEIVKSYRSLHFDYTQEKLIEVDGSRKKLQKSISQNLEYNIYLTGIIDMFLDLEEVDIQINL